MMNFREISLSDREWMISCRDPEQHPFTALSFPSLFAWRKTYGLTVVGNSNFFAVHSRHDNAYYCPCGEEKLCRQFIAEICRSEKHPRFLYLTREQAKKLQNEGFSILMRDDLSEYISAAGSLALMDGYHASNSYKMKVRRFQKAVPYTLRPVTPEDIPLLREIVLRQPAEAVGDEEVAGEEIESFALLNLKGTLLEAPDGRKAFILGYEDTPDIFTMTMTKHDSAFPAQVTAVLMYALACQLGGKYRLINLEEDLGLTGLRQAKLLYTPVDRLNVYEAIR